MVHIDPDPFSGPQHDRRRAVVRAAIALAEEGGYDAVQMRQVAGRANVALGTLYHYFSSKDHLLAQTMVDWTHEFDDQISDHRPGELVPQDRVVAVMMRATVAMSASPNITKAMVTALNSPGPEVAEAKEALSVIMSQIISDALAPDVPEGDRARMARSIEHVWYSTLLAWVNGWMDAEQVQEELIDAVRLIVPS